ncbi:NAD(P)H-dependent oxidoreductase [Roseivirga pacifica]|uniref:NAD(P)H-dependent oxidoreductase n=1 Tax=Roseivirga pacifica TaxID=1267423 RepID=UPI003BB17D23
MKNILVINGHPNPESFNYALSRAYAQGALESGVEVNFINLAELTFDPNLKYGYSQPTPLEPDLVDAIEKIKAADHLVWFFPMWWYGTPAILKGFIDRTFLPGITYKTVPGKPLPQKLLKGKTARVVITADTPSWYNWLFMGRPAIHQFKRGVLHFCGVRPVKVTYLATIKGASPEKLNGYLNKVKSLGRKLA